MVPPGIRFESISIARDLKEVGTWFVGAPLMVKIGVAVRVLSFCLEPISINSVLVIFSVSLFAISHSLMFWKSLLRQD